MRASKRMEWLQNKFNALQFKMDRTKVPSLHCTAILKGNKIITMKTNRVGCPCKTLRSGGRYSASSSPATLHSEVAAIRAVSVKSLRNADLYVWRCKVQPDMTINSSVILNSKPCPDCQTVLQSCMRKYGIHNIYYSI